MTPARQALIAAHKRVVVDSVREVLLPGGPDFLSAILRALPNGVDDDRMVVVGVFAFTRYPDRGLRVDGPAGASRNFNDRSFPAAIRKAVVHVETCMDALCQRVWDGEP